jgi:hypothetical protein
MNIEHARTYITVSLLIGLANVLISIGGLASRWELMNMFENILSITLILIMLGLLYGLRKENNICAIIILIIYTLNLIITLVFLQGAGLIWSILTVSSGYIGVKGTLFYNKNIN